MFDLGFWELMLIGVIALLVVGPERLPGLARNAGLWVGKLRRFVQSVKQDIDEELAADQLKKTLEEQAAIPELEELIEESQHYMEDIGGGSSDAVEDKTRLPESEVSTKPGATND